VWLARGDVLLARAERRAEYCFTRALAAGAGDWLWSWLASRIHYFHRKFSLALKLVTQALSLDGSQAVIWMQMGRCQLALGLAEGATESFNQARELDPQGQEVRLLARESRDFGWWDGWVGRCRRWLDR
jgi:Flp pilus assembly protein TadD